MAEQDDLTGDLSLVDHNRLQERIRMSNKQRTMQLKAYEQNEKRMAKQQLSADKKLFNKRSKKGGSGVDLAGMRNSKIVFGDGVLMMDVIARKDIPECKRFLFYSSCIFSYLLKFRFIYSWTLLTPLVMKFRA